MAPRTTPPFRADHVGSLLRPERLMKAREDFAAGAIDADELHAVEDDAIREAVQMQHDVGLRSATDGEFRRATWHMDFIYELGGINKVQGDIKVEFRNEQGTIEFTPAAIHVGREGPPRAADLRGRLRVPSVERVERRHAQAHDPLAEHGPLPRRPGGHRRLASTRTSTPSGRTSPTPTPTRSARSASWAAPTCSSTTRASPT